MIQPQRSVGDTFPLQFVWQLPDGDYIRAIFEVQVVALDTVTDRYVVRLEKLVARRQETASGEMRPQEAMAADYWSKVKALVGRKAAVAYELDDGQPIRLRLTTLTLEHKFFTRI